MLHFSYIHFGGTIVTIPTGKIKEMHLYSDALQEEMALLVYYPANYTPLQKYSFCIVNDGKDYIQMGRLGRVADSLLHEKKIENVIFIGIHYNNVPDRRAKYHPDGEKNAKYIRFLAHELIPFLDEHLPGYCIGHGRALMGDSLAATVGLMAALNYPHTFGRVIMHSPYVNEKVLEKAGSFPDPSLLQLYHTVGTKETDVHTSDGKVTNFLKANRKLASLFKERGFPSVSEEFEGDHTWKYWQKDLPHALEMMFGQ